MLPASSFQLLSSIFGFVLLFAFCGPVIFGQGQQEIHPGSMNTNQDIANSLATNHKPKRGKETIEQVDPQKLQSHGAKDTTFSGSLLNAGLDSTNQAKQRTSASPADKNSNASASTDSSSQKNSKVSTSTNSDANAANKEEKAKPSPKFDQKSSGDR